ncbi:MAG: aminopeptidase P family protein [Lentisphaeria bacterium]|nr:aminopeptidase P family protein [Lentisphaeria bacterium]
MKIEKSEFESRVAGIRGRLEAEGLDALMVYGDEYRKENLRYVCNYWPIFERGACFISRDQVIFAGAPEGEKYAREMCVWEDIRNVREFACVSVPEEIDYPLAEFSSFRDILGEVLKTGKRLGVAGFYDMSGFIAKRLNDACPGLETVDAAGILNELRLIKTPAEIACLRRAGELACTAYREFMKYAIPGNTELKATGAAEGAARMAGAEAINFTVCGTGKRADTVIGRPTEKIIEDGDMVMCAVAVQYAGYVSTVEYPFVAGTPSDGQKRFLRALFEAANEQQKFLHDGVRSGDMVRAVKAVFARHGLSEYDVYPPMHGIGLAEAESPYPDTESNYSLRSGMCVNSDISLFGHPDGSNRIEEGFVITEKGPESLTPLIRELVVKGI